MAERAHEAAVGRMYAMNELVRMVKEKEKPPVTNADRIRVMSDEELAEYLSKVQGDIFRGEMRLTHQWLDWLKSPAEVEE